MEVYYCLLKIAYPIIIIGINTTNKNIFFPESKVGQWTVDSKMAAWLTWLIWLGQALL
jgi:hypothetical protein